MTEKKTARQDIDSFFDKPQAVASMTECTGLLQVPADSDAEIDALTDIYDIPLAKKDEPTNRDPGATAEAIQQDK